MSVKELAKFIKYHQVEEFLELINSKDIDVNEKIPGSKKYTSLIQLAFSVYFETKDPRIINSLVKHNANYAIELNGTPLLFSFIKYNMQSVIETILDKGLDVDKFNELTGKNLMSYIEHNKNKSAYLIKDAKKVSKYAVVSDAILEDDLDYVKENLSLVDRKDIVFMISRTIFKYSKGEINLKRAKEYLDLLIIDENDVNHFTTKRIKDEAGYDLGTRNYYLDNIFYNNKKHKRNREGLLTNEDDNLLLYLLDKGFNPYSRVDLTHSFFSEILDKKAIVIIDKMIEKGFLNTQDEDYKKYENKIVEKISTSTNPVQETFLYNEKIAGSVKTKLIENAFENDKTNIIVNYIQKGNVQFIKDDIYKFVKIALYNENLTLIKELCKLNPNIDFNTPLFTNDSLVNSGRVLSLPRTTEETYFLYQALTGIHKDRYEVKSKKINKREKIYDYLIQKGADFNLQDKFGRTTAFNLIKLEAMEDIKYLNKKGYIDLKIKDHSNDSLIDYSFRYSAKTPFMINTGIYLLELGVDVSDSTLENIRNMQKRSPTSEKINEFISLIEKVNLNKILSNVNEKTIDNIPVKKKRL